MSVKITVNRSAIAARIEAGKNKMIAQLSEKILQDCNKYVRVDQGTLKNSSYTASEPDKGRLVWNTPYAKRVYYTGTPSHDVNPNASLQWCEKAHQVHGKEWEAAAQNLFERGMK